MDRFTSQDDPILIDRIKSGDVAVFERLFNAYYAPLCLYAGRMTGDPDKARDIVQDIFVNFYSNCKKLQINTSIRGYLFRTVHNACLNHIKQLKTHAFHHEYLKLHLQEWDDRDVMIRMELEQRIRLAIGDLPEQCREIFEMNRFEGKKNSDIARILGISVRTVETQISKALRILREHLKDYLVMAISALAFLK